MVKLIMVLLLMVMVFETDAFSAEDYSPTWESLDKRPIPQWFGEDKFGIMVCWGPYSVPAWRRVTEGIYNSYAEWYYARVMFDEKNGGRAFHEANYGEDFEYRDFGPLFRAELFDPDLWAKLFARSGARYVVLTAKYHDGFCLWPSKSPHKKNWNSVQVGPKRNLVKELTDAVRKTGLRMGLYYSIFEFETNPRDLEGKHYLLPEHVVKKYALPEDVYINQVLVPELKELVLEYQPAVIFADAGEWTHTAKAWKTIDFLAWLYNHGPNRQEVVVNDRFGKDMPGKHGDYFSSEYEDTDAVGPGHPWEESRGMGVSYGFNRAEQLDDYRTSEQLIHELISVVSRGGNFLLNVGPTADGRIPVIQQQRLTDIGAWLDVNGEGIFKTRSWELSSQNQALNPGCFFTKKGRNIYAIWTRWPQKTFEIKGAEMGARCNVRMLGYPKAVQWKKEKDRILIDPPPVNPATSPCDHAWVFEISNGD